jgi:signal transduction histidine kinase
MELIPEHVNIHAEVEGVLHLLRNDAENKHITLKNEAPDDAGVIADRSMFRSLIQNLVSNAIKFTRTGGWVRVEVLTEQDWIHVSISDNGVGMSDETRRNLFNLESNVSTRGTEQEPGTGLGLIICSEIINKHAGKIAVYSTPDQGTTFLCSFPGNPTMEVPKPTEVFHSTY